MMTKENTLFVRFEINNNSYDNLFKTEQNSITSSLISEIFNHLVEILGEEKIKIKEITFLDLDI